MHDDVLELRTVSNYDRQAEKSRALRVLGMCLVTTAVGMALVLLQITVSSNETDQASQREKEHKLLVSHAAYRKAGKHALATALYESAMQNPKLSETTRGALEKAQRALETTLRIREEAENFRRLALAAKEAERQLAGFELALSTDPSLPDARIPALETAIAAAGEAQTRLDTLRCAQRGLALFDANSPELQSPAALALKKRLEAIVEATGQSQPVFNLEPK